MDIIYKKTWRIKYLIIFMLPILLAYVLKSNADPSRSSITFACGIDPTLPIFKELENRYRIAFDRMGYDFYMSPANGQRALVNANMGVFDGECVRIGSVIEAQKNLHLIRVDVLLGITELSVWSYDKNLHINNAEDIKKGNYKIGFPLGSLMSEKFVADNQLENITRTTNLPTSIKMLSAQRFDVLIVSSDLVRQQLHSIQLRTPIYKVGVLARLKAYPFIHESKRELIPRFTQELHKVVPPEGIPLEQ